MVDHGFFHKIYEWGLYVVAAIAWWLFRRHTAMIDRKFENQAKKNDHFEEEINLLKTNEAVNRTHLEHLVKCSEHIKKSIEKLDQKIDKKLDKNNGS